MNKHYLIGFIPQTKDVIQGKLFQKCTHLLYCSVLSLGGNVNTRRKSKPDKGSIFHIKKSKKYSGHKKNYYVKCQNYQNLIILTSSDTKRTLMNLFLFTNSAQRELVSICMQSIREINFPCITTLPQTHPTSPSRSIQREAMGP